MSERQFILSCESTVDLPYAYVAGRDIPVLIYSYVIDGVTYIDDMGRDPDSIPSFYRRLYYCRPLWPGYCSGLLPWRPPCPGEMIGRGGYHRPSCSRMFPMCKADFSR